MRLTREIRCWLDESRSDHGKPPSNTWSGTPCQDRLSPFVALRVTVYGKPDPATGMICDIRELDQSVRREIASLDIRPHLPLASLVSKIWQQLSEQCCRLTDVQLLDVEVCYSPYLRFSVSRKVYPMVSMTQQYEFAAAHRLHCPSLSDEENRILFGKCNHPHGHGHNYLLEVTVTGDIDDALGTVMPLGQLDGIVQDRVLREFDHRHLNVDIDDFRTANPTVELIARAIWRRLADHVAPARLQRIRLYETPKTWVDVEDDDVC